MFGLLDLSNDSSKCDLASVTYRADPLRNGACILTLILTHITLLLRLNKKILFICWNLKVNARKQNIPSVWKIAPVLLQSTLDNSK